MLFSAYRDCEFCILSHLQLPHSDHINCPACRCKLMLSSSSSTQLTYLFLFVISALVASVNGQDNRVADADPKYVATQSGQSINLMCRVAQPIQTCRFALPTVPEIKLNPKWAARTDNFQYFGSGLDQGQCGLTIHSVREEYHGNATCILDPDDGGNDARGNIEIVIAKAPQLPQISVENQNQLEAGEYLDADCSSVDGRPAANISWYLGDQPLGPGQSEIFENSDGGATYYTVHSKLRYQLKPQDHTQNLICRASHPGYPEGFSDTRLNLNINFRPVALPETVISGLELGSSANIGPITIQANPRPSVKWTVDGTVITQGEQTQRFVANEPVQVGVAMWNVSLTVIELTLQDTTRAYRLRAHNAFGEREYSIRIGGSQDVAGKAQRNKFFSQSKFH